MVGAAVRGFSVARVTFIFLSFCALVGSGAASDRPAEAGRGGQERSVSSSPQSTKAVCEIKQEVLSLSETVCDAFRSSCPAD